MTHAAYARIERLKAILQENAPQLDVDQIAGLLTDLSDDAEQRERDRVLALIDRFIVIPDALRGHIENGQQLIEY